MTPDATARRLAALCTEALRPPLSTETDAATGAPVLVFEPPLSAAEQAVYDDLARMVRLRVTGLTLAEYQVLKPTLQGLATYRDATSPTAAQTAAAVKGIIDVLRALVTG